MSRFIGVLLQSRAHAAPASARGGSPKKSLFFTAESYSAAAEDLLAAPHSSDRVPPDVLPAPWRLGGVVPSHYRHTIINLLTSSLRSCRNTCQSRQCSRWQFGQWPGAPAAEARLLKHRQRGRAHVGLHHGCELRLDFTATGSLGSWLRSAHGSCSSCCCCQGGAGSGSGGSLGSGGGGEEGAVLVRRQLTAPSMRI